METTNILQYNGNIVSDVNWRGNLPVSTLRVVTDNVEAEWSKGSVEPSFNATLYGIGGGGEHNRHPNFSIDTKNLVQYTQTTQSTFLKSQFVIHLSGNNYGDIIIPTSRIHTDSNFRAFLYDNKIIVSDISGGVFDFYPENIISSKKQFRLNNEIDETERNRVDNMLCKVIRIPHSGSTGNISFDYLPMTFNDRCYIDSPIFILLKQGSTELDYSFTTPNNTITEAEITIHPTKTGAIDYNLEYAVQQNNTSKYREWSIACTDQGVLYDGVQDGSIVLNYGTSLKAGFVSFLHLIQEPYAKNRIYWGNGFNTPVDNVELMWKYFFQGANGVNITKDSYSIDVFRSTKIAIPNDFDYDIVYDDEMNKTVISNNYIWGTQSYTTLYVWGFDGKKKITFNRKQL